MNIIVSLFLVLLVFRLLRKSGNTISSDLCYYKVRRNNRTRSKVVNVLQVINGMSTLPPSTDSDDNIIVGFKQRLIYKNLKDFRRKKIKYVGKPFRRF